MSPPRPVRIRIEFCKFGRIRFTSHRDVARIWERSLRRLALPISYSEGFSPRPRLHFGLALATAHESCGEYLDVDLKPETLIDIDGLTDRLNPTLAPGMRVLSCGMVPAGTSSLQESVTSCDWLIGIPGVEIGVAATRIAEVLAAEELRVTRERKGRTITDDIRPAIANLRLVDAVAIPPEADWHPVGTLLEAELSTQERTCRPAELLAALGAQFTEGRVVRLKQWIDTNGTRCTPMTHMFASRDVGLPLVGSAAGGAH